MWASFVDAAEPLALLADGEPVGYGALNAESELLAFYLQPEFRHVGPYMLKFLITHLELTAGIVSTIDPLSLSLCLEAGHSPETRALMYEHVLEPRPGVAPLELRVATAADLEAAIAFDEAAIGAPRSFLEPYLGARIENGELLLCERDGAIIASGECRVDTRAPGHVHLGMIVGREHRGTGLGRRMMHTLVDECRARNLKPLCSTEPDNVPAQRAIESAGFRSQHRVFRIAYAPGHL